MNGICIGISLANGRYVHVSVMTFIDRRLEVRFRSPKGEETCLSFFSSFQVPSLVSNGSFIVTIDDGCFTSLTSFIVTFYKKEIKKGHCFIFVYVRVYIYNVHIVLASRFSSRPCGLF